MHHRAEYGIAAHWGYKSKEDRRASDWPPRRWRGCSASPTVDRQTDPIEFLEALKLDLEQDEVYVFTPKGKVIALPPTLHAGRLRLRHPHRGRATAASGPRSTAAWCRSTPSSTRPTRWRSSRPRSPTAGPSRDWLQIVASSRARNKIRQWFSRERREDAIELGREELIKELRREGLPVQKLASSALQRSGRVMNWPTSTRCTPPSATTGSRPGPSPSDPAGPAGRGLRGAAPVTARQQPGPPGRPGLVGRRLRRGPRRLMVHLSRCCTPVPGDEIVGFVTRGRGVSVHRADCANAARWPPVAERLIEVEWDHRSTGSSWPPSRWWPSTAPACWPT
jgi:guanosine-3',5'-bis(diphosphate) 3'-pyrophosphohydrolase